MSSNRKPVVGETWISYVGDVPVYAHIDRVSAVSVYYTLRWRDSHGEVSGCWDDFIQFFTMTYEPYTKLHRLLNA